MTLQIGLCPPTLHMATVSLCMVALCLEMRLPSMSFQCTSNLRFLLLLLKKLLRAGMTITF